jgi:hypothetical protein
MPSYSSSIAEAVVTILSGMTPSGCPCVWRKTDAMESRDPTTIVIVTNGPESQTNRGSLGGVSTPQYAGSVQKGYTIGITVYGSNLADLAGDDVNPSFILQAKQALNTYPPFGVSAYVPEVFDTDLIENNYEWENQPFKAGVEVSRFAVGFFTSEPRNG